MVADTECKPASTMRPYVLLTLALIGVCTAIVVSFWHAQRTPSERADPSNVQQVAVGRAIYRQHCASCHGANLEGQPNWRRRNPNGRLPAPPHDRTGHTWEHPDETLFKVTKHGVKPFVSPEYETDMRGFGDVLSDEEIWAVIAFIKGSWPPALLEKRRPVK